MINITQENPAKLFTDLDAILVHLVVGKPAPILLLEEKDAHPPKTIIQFDRERAQDWLLILKTIRYVMDSLQVDLSRARSFLIRILHHLPESVTNDALETLISSAHFHYDYRGYIFQKVIIQKMADRSAKRNADL